MGSRAECRYKRVEYTGAVRFGIQKMERWMKGTVSWESTERFPNCTLGFLAMQTISVVLIFEWKGVGGCLSMRRVFEHEEGVLSLRLCPNLIFF
jgi:hypothetical protein